jgi:hypothetical protein
MHGSNHVDVSAAIKFRKIGAKSVIPKFAEIFSQNLLICYTGWATLGNLRLPSATFGYLRLPSATFGYLRLPWAYLSLLGRAWACLVVHGRAWATIGIIFLCARTFQGLHSVRLWTPTIFILSNLMCSNKLWHRNQTFQSLVDKFRIIPFFLA